MPSLVPGIHVLAAPSKKDVDGRVKPGDDEKRIIPAIHALASFADMVRLRAEFSRQSRI